MSGSNFNPQNTQCIPACPVGPEDRTGVVKIFAFLGLEPRLNIKYGFNWAGDAAQRRSWTFYEAVKLN